MPEIFRSIPRTDQQRDRLFLDNFLDALSMVKDILVQEQTDEAVFKPLLPIIKKAFQDERAFELVYGPEKAEPDHLEILAVDPPLDQPGKQIPLTPLFKKLLKRDDARAIQFTPELIAGLEPLQAKKALLIHVKVEGKDHVVGVCSSKEREEALYLGYEARELKVIVELMIFGLRYGAHRKKMLESVQDTAIHLRGDLQPENLLQKLIENAVTLTQTDAGAIMLEEREDGPLVVQNSTRLSEHYCQQQRVERAVYEQALASHEPDRPIIFRDFQRDGLGDLGLIYEEQLQGVLSISMQWGDNHLGAFNLYSKTKDYSFTEEQILIAKTMAEQAGLTLEWEHARQREIQGLRMGSNALGAIRASAEFSQQIFLEQARELLGADGSAVYLADPKSDKWFIHLPESLEIPEDLFMAGVGLLNENRRILEKNESVFVPDLRRFHKLYRHLSERINFVNSLLITPLHNGRRLTGALMLFYAEENHKLSAHQYEIAHIICEQAAAALEIMNLRQKEQQRNKQLEILDRLTLKVAQIPDPKELLDEIISGAMDLVNGQGGVIYRWIEPENEFEIAAIVGTRSQSHFVKKRIPSERGIIQKVHADLKPCAINNYNLWEHRQPELEELNLSAVIGAPLIAGSDFYGVLAIHSSTPGFTFNDEDTRILQRFVNHAVTTLVNREIAELNKQARTFLENALEINKKISQAATLQQGLEFLGQGMLQQAQVSFCLLAISTPPPPGANNLRPLLYAPARRIVRV